MNYRELQEFLSTFNEEQLAMTVTVYDKSRDEFVGVDRVGVTADDDVLHANHPYLIAQWEN